LPSVPALTVSPIALDAWDWVTTVQESKLGLPEVEADGDVDDALGGAVADDEDGAVVEEEPHAASTTAVTAARVTETHEPVRSRIPITSPRTLATRQDGVGLLRG